MPDFAALRRQDHTKRGLILTPVCAAIWAGLFCLDIGAAALVRSFWGRADPLDWGLSFQETQLVVVVAVVVVNCWILKPADQQPNTELERYFCVRGFFVAFIVQVAIFFEIGHGNAPLIRAVAPIPITAIALWLLWRNYHRVVQYWEEHSGTPMARSGGQFDEA